MSDILDDFRKFSARVQPDRRNRMPEQYDTTIFRSRFIFYPLPCLPFKAAYIRNMDLELQEWHACSSLPNFIGNGITTGILSGDSKIVSREDFDYHKYCGSKFCPYVTIENATAIIKPAKETMYIMTGVFIVPKIFSVVLVALFLDPLARYSVFDARRDSFKLKGFQLLLVTLRNLRDRKQQLLVFLSLWIGTINSFSLAEYPMAYITCGWGIQYVGASKHGFELHLNGNWRNMEAQPWWRIVPRFLLHVWQVEMRYMSPGKWNLATYMTPAQSNQTRSRSNLNLLVVSSLVYCENSALDHETTEVVRDVSCMPITERSKIHSVDRSVSTPRDQFLKRVQV
uniref:Uncharacterized protein n=1 Tax=Timema bartmani TaxID=61472 RepID=A0A7R9F842_9NEOP|nr:unnamed protein product [Timema bartmani]